MNKKQCWRQLVLAPEFSGLIFAFSALFSVIFLVDVLCGGQKSIDKVNSFGYTLLVTMLRSALRCVLRIVFRSGEG